MSRPQHSRRAWRALNRKNRPQRIADVPLERLLGAVAGEPESGRTILRELGGDLSRLPELVPHLDTLPGIGAGTAFRVAAAVELSRRLEGKS